MSMSGARTLGGTFEKHLLPYAQSDGAPEHELPTWPIVRKRQGVAIIGCSTGLPSPVPLADGWLGRVGSYGGSKRPWTAPAITFGCC
jgi:hypothetical protein